MGVEARSFSTTDIRPALHREQLPHRLPPREDPACVSSSRIDTLFHKNHLIKPAQPKTNDSKPEIELFGFEVAYASVLNNASYIEALRYGKEAEKSQEQARQLLEALYRHHQETFYHTLGVTANALAIAKIVHLSPEKEALFVRSAFLHDAGKLGVPQEILNKKETLTDEEWEILKNHPVESFNILMAQGDVETARMALAHHQMQKRPYPDDPVLDEEYEHHDIRSLLPPADVADALLNERSYKEPWPEWRTKSELLRSYGDRLMKLYDERFRRAFSPDLVRHSQIKITDPNERFLPFNNRNTPQRIHFRDNVINAAVNGRNRLHKDQQPIPIEVAIPVDWPLIPQGAMVYTAVEPSNTR